MKKIFLLAACSVSYLFTLGQQGIIKGMAFDTLTKQPVVSATITLLKQKDSSLVSFTMTDAKGQFTFSGVANGAYRLMVTHVNYHNSNRFVTIDNDHREIDLGQLVLIDKSKMLDEVTVTAEAPPVTLVGDTVQYNAGSFKTAPNASVEDLLEKLPGVKVEKDGTLKAQGQEVKKVMVDGKEFFGTDPKIATRNLPADAIDKVQVYDRMSDQAQLTGFDDGNSEKTINLTLKKDKKKGMFGKVTAGAGNKDRYEGKFNVNSFKGARQLSVIGMGNNTNAEGFSFRDMLNFNGGLTRDMAAGGPRIQINIANDNNNSNNNTNDGINTIWGGGINYNNIIGNKTEFTSNYFYNRYHPNTESRTQRQYFLPDSSYFYNQHAQTKTLNNSHKLNLGADIQIDSFHSLKITPSLGYQQSSNHTLSDYQTLSAEQRPGSEGFSDAYSYNEGFNFRNDLLFRKKFRQKGRTFSLSLQNNWNTSDGDGSLTTANTFRNAAGQKVRTDSLDQQYTSNSDLSGYTARAVYTEPLFKKSLLEFSLAKSHTKSTASKLTYDYNETSKQHDLLNEALSNDYENIYGYHTAGIRWRMQQKKWNLSAGVNWQQSDLEGKIILGNKDSVIGQSFYNWLPNARWQYSFTRYKTLRLSYTTSTNQPTVSQLQPVPDISDPLNIRAGNPDLKQEFTHALQLLFFSVNPFANKNLFAFVNLRRTDNKIVNYDVIDSLGVKTTTPVNVDGVYNMVGDINWGFPLGFVKGNVNLSTGAGYTKSKQFINGVMNGIDALDIGPNLRLDFSLSEKLDLILNGGFNYYKTSYSLQPALNTEYFNQVYGSELSWQLPAHFFFNTEFTYTINSQRAAGFNTEVPLWNASISKQFLRFNRGELKFSAFDLLNRNVGVSRNANQNYIEDKRVVTLQRFFMLSFTYSLSRNGLAMDGAEKGMRIIRR
jgi:hypothetical protein